MIELKHKVEVGLDPKGALLIRCPFWANELIRKIPSRRWNRSAQAWRVPIIRQNVVEVKELIKLAGVEASGPAVAALANYDKQIEKMASGRNSGFPAWYKFKTTPRKHQQQAIDKGYGLEALALFMDMQTGKSKTAIDLTAAHRMEGHISGVLIMVKLSLRKNWVLQFQQHCPIPYSIYLPNTDKEREFHNWLALKHDFKIMVVGWESLSAGKMKDWCKTFLVAPMNKRRAIIGDETTYITNHKATRSELAVELARMASYRYALTGTPAIEGPMNLFMQFEFLDPNIIGIGDFFAFRNRYAIMGGFMREIRPGHKIPTEIVGYQDLDELMTTIAPHTFQVMKKDAYDLPPKRYELREVELMPEQRAIYKQVKDSKTLRLRDDTNMVLKNVLEVALRLHQVTGGYSVTPREERWIGKDGNPKVKMVYDSCEIMSPAKNPKMIELMSTVADWKTKQGLIWVVYSPEIRAIVKLMKDAGYKIGELHGDIKEPDRQPMVNAFQKGNLQWIVGNASTGGMGYTMMASEVNIFYNNTFKAIDRAQAEDRAYGDGQTKSGVWIDIVAAKTVDNTILAALEQKQDLSTFVRTRIDQAINLLDGDMK